MAKLNTDFYIQSDVVQMARDLLGKVLVTEFDGYRTAGLITETEAYRAPDDKACHAFENRRTARTEVMFQQGGLAYVYLCYGIHHLFNVVTGPAEMAHAVLVRAIEPVDGHEIMLERRLAAQKGGGKKSRLSTNDPRLTVGPGAMSQAMGIQVGFTGRSLVDPLSTVWIEAGAHPVLEQEIVAGPRIGVDYAAECADWPWRFWLKGSKWHK